MEPGESFEAQDALKAIQVSGEHGTRLSVLETGNIFLTR